MAPTETTKEATYITPRTRPKFRSKSVKTRDLIASGALRRTANAIIPPPAASIKKSRIPQTAMSCFDGIFEIVYVIKDSVWIKMFG
jgi:hypothetical protein